jgi:hypothetical protein
MLDPDPYPDPHKINADPQPCGQEVRIRVADPYSLRTRIQHFRLNTDPDPRGLMTKNCEKFTDEKKNFLDQKLQFTYP